MDELITKAQKFLQEHSFINEIELEDGFHNKVKIVRNISVVWQTPPLPGYAWTYSYQPPVVK